MDDALEYPIIAVLTATIFAYIILVIELAKRGTTLGSAIFGFALIGHGDTKPVRAGFLRTFAWSLVGHFPLTTLVETLAYAGRYATNGSATTNHASLELPFNRSTTHSPTCRFPAGASFGRSLVDSVFNVEAVPAASVAYVPPAASKPTQLPASPKRAARNSVEAAVNAPREFKDVNGAVLFVLAQVAFFGAWKFGLFELLPVDKKSRFV